MKPQRARVSYQKPPEPSAKLLTWRNPEELLREAQPVELAIARRAYELFQARGGEHGHDWEDWFRAASELLRPVSVTMSESEDRLSVRANVLGFEANELKVSIEPRRITILGEKGPSVMQAEPGKTQPIVTYPDQILHVIGLSTDVTAENAVVEWKEGVLQFELPKAGKPRLEAASAA
jgi:HSP20 family protein